MTHAIRIHQPGGPEALSWETVEIGEPGPGQVRLRQTAIGINFIDIYHRTGLYPMPLPFTPGQEGAGVVEAVGPGVEDLKPGDRVGYPSLPGGGYAEARLAPADRLVILPDGIDDKVAASSMLRGMTVRYLIREIHKVGPGDTILIHAAAGGIGLILCQWAAALGATVIGTVSTDEKAALARANGCHHPLVVPRENFVARVAEITEGRKLPVVYDSVGLDTYQGSFDCLRRRGIAVFFGQSSGKVPPIDLGILAAKGSLFVTRPSLGHYITTRGELAATAADWFDAVLSGKVRVHVNQSFALKDAAEAHRALESRATTGSTVLIP